MHEVAELFSIQVLVLSPVWSLRLVVLLESKRQISLKQCIVLPAIRFFLILVSCTSSLPSQHLIRVEPVGALLINGCRHSSMVRKAGRYKTINKQIQSGVNLHLASPRARDCEVPWTTSNRDARSSRCCARPISTPSGKYWPETTL